MRYSREFLACWVRTFKNNDSIQQKQGQTLAASAVQRGLDDRIARENANLLREVVALDADSLAL